jgi:KamA family protein
VTSGKPIPPNPAPFKVYTAANIDRIPQFARLDPDRKLAMKAVATVLPFRTNQYVVDELIDWDKVPADPIFQLTFPQPGMLDPADRAVMARLLEQDAPPAEIAARANRIRKKLNPHPGGQMTLNVPELQSGTKLPGVQHKYEDTVLVFPSQGQTCHAYCTYCFRWPQFVGMDEMKFAQREVETFLQYLREHHEITDVLFTGGDPMVMRTRILRTYIEPLLGAGFEHVRHIRIGTKAVAYWPQRFVTDADADELLRLFDDVVRAGKHVAIMGHYSHPVELSTRIAQEAVRRIRRTGAEMRCQAPLIRHVNDDAAAWKTMWRRQVRLGAIPYYMFVERDTGPKRYFEVPLVRAHRIFRDAWKDLTGLARTVRGPSMSALPGKVQVDGITRVNGEKVIALSFLRGRNKEWVKRPFFARYDERACWLDELRPAFGESEFFFEKEMRERGRSRKLRFSESA